MLQHPRTWKATRTICSRATRVALGQPRGATGSSDRQRSRRLRLKITERTHISLSSRVFSTLCILNSRCFVSFFFFVSPSQPTARELHVRCVHPQCPGSILKCGATGKATSKKQKIHCPRLCTFSHDRHKLLGVGWGGKKGQRPCDVEGRRRNDSFCCACTPRARQSRHSQAPSMTAFSLPLSRDITGGTHRVQRVRETSQVLDS